jgi:hypothetical protein
VKNQNHIKIWAVSAVVAPVLLFTTLATAQSPAAKPARPAASAGTVLIPNDRDLAETQSQLIKLLRLSPTLTDVVSHDPSLLANQEYVNRNNPQLAQFLAAHPEIARNPDYYLFSHMKHEDGNRDEALERAVWPELVQPRYETPINNPDFTVGSLFLLGFIAFLGTFLWLVRVFARSRRWSRVFKLQSEIHGKLIDKIGSSQDLAVYMNAEVGKHFLEGAPLPEDCEGAHRVPSAVVQMLSSLQTGIVLVFLGTGLLLLRHTHSQVETPMLVLGTLALMPGLGFIVSAGITWVLSKRLGLMPEKSVVENKPDTLPNSTLDPRERQ